MRHHQVFGDGQAKASARPRCARRVRLVEPLEHAGQTLGLDADARVRDPQLDVLLAAARSGDDATGTVMRPINR